MIVGEAFGEKEEAAGQPFVGSSGHLLRAMMQEAGLSLDDARVTNVVNARPPRNDISHWFLNKTQAKKEGLTEVWSRYPNAIVRDGLARLEDEVIRTQPNLILAVGGTALWALTGQEGIMKWRGSQLHHHQHPEIRVVPIIHPASILRQYSDRQITVHDLKTRVTPYLHSPWPTPEYRYLLRPTFADASDWLTSTLRAADKKPGGLWLAHDLETSPARQLIVCNAFASSDRDAICIPFHTLHGPYWTAEQEAELVLLHRQILTHPNIRIIGQNYEYDRQYILRRWFVRASLAADTMTLHHTCFPGLRKSLDFISSLYAAYYSYWKDESKEWVSTYDDDRYWTYNCLDATYTFECNTELQKLVDKMNLREQADFQMALHEPTFDKNNRGVRVDTDRLSDFANYLIEAMLEREGWFEAVIGRTIGSSDKPWYRSPTQLQTLLLSWFKVAPVLNRTTGRPTTDSDALTTYIQRDPLLRPILSRLIEYRSLGIFYRTFIQANLGLDKRIRCQFNIDGTETFRFSSRENAFGEGTNLQTIPKGN
jgi:DNA polymerase